MASADSASKFVLIQGAGEPGDKPGIRREFSAWATDKPETSIQVSLFIRALQKFYDEKHTKTLSYFQIASIHGYPGGLRWDNAAPPTFSRDGKHFIYCTHNTLAFPTWHRPYMLLFEQTVYNLMEEVINNDLTFHTQEEKEKWLNERRQWRLPYWNWALKTSLPSLFRTANVNIRVPLGRLGIQPPPEVKQNPLYRYQLRVDGKLTKMGDLEAPYKIDDVDLKDDKGKVVLTLPWSKCSGTSRWGITSNPPSSDQSEGVNNYDSIGKAIDLPGWYGPKGPKDPNRDILKHSVSDLVYRLLSNVKDWASFSSTITSGPGEPGATKWEQWISLEYIHNNLHGFIGGSGDFTTGLGHMMNVPVAAFDPVFYMHHGYIDSLFAIWQTLNETAWFEGEHKHIADLDLTPFHHEFPDKTVKYFNSNDIVKWTDFGYQYDVLEHHEGETQKQYVARIVTYVNETYHGTGELLLADSGKLFSKLEQDSDRIYDDYLINVEYDRYGYQNGSPYTIHFFLGAPVAQLESSAYSTGLGEAPRHVGSIYSFSTPIDDGNVAAEAASHCPNCQQQHDEGILSRASIPLTIPLYRDAVNDSIDEISDILPKDVERYLAKELSWVAVDSTGHIIPWSELEKTKIFVLKGKSDHFRGQADILSVYKDYEPLLGATHGKEGGAPRAEYGRYA